LWPSQIKKLVARAERSNEPSTTAQTDTIEIPPTEILDRIFNLKIASWRAELVTVSQWFQRVGS
jgi:hypothetical protein